MCSILLRMYLSLLSFWLVLLLVRLVNQSVNFCTASIKHSAAEGMMCVSFSKVMKRSWSKFNSKKIIEPVSCAMVRFCHHGIARTDTLAPLRHESEQYFGCDVCMLQTVATTISAVLPLPPSSTLQTSFTAPAAYASPGFFTTSSTKSSVPATQSSPLFSFSASSSTSTGTSTTAALGGATFPGGFGTNPGSGFSFGTSGFKFGSGAAQPSVNTAADQPASGSTNAGEGLFCFWILFIIDILLCNWLYYIDEYFAYLFNMYTKMLGL